MSFTNALSNRGFAGIWSASVASDIGSSIHSIAVIWVAYSLSGDPFVVSAVAISALLPDLLFSLPAGVLVDRLNRKWVLVGADSVRFLAVGTIPFVFWYGPQSWLIPAIIGTAVIEGLMAAFTTPARSALVPKVVDKQLLDSANGLLKLTSSVSRAFYLVGGAVIALLGPAGAFAINATSFAVSALLLLRVDSSDGVPEDTADRRETSSYLRAAFSEGTEGLQHIRQDSVVLSVVFLSILAGIAMGPLSIVLPFFLQIAGSGGSFAYGLVYGSMFVGIVLGSILVGSMDKWVESYRGYIMIIGVVVSGLALGGLSEASVRANAFLATASLLMVVFGVGIAAVQVPGGTLMQRRVPDDRRGKVFSVVKVLALSAPPLAIAAASPLVEIFGPKLLLSYQSSLLILAGGLLLVSPLRRVGEPHGPHSAD